MGPKRERDEQRSETHDLVPSPWARALPWLVFVLALLPFSASLSFGYLDLDDDRNLLPQFNPWFNAGNHALSSSTLSWMFTANHYGHYQPLTWLSYALDAALWGRFEPQVFHRTNVLLHGAVAALVYRLALALARAARGRTTPALRAGAFFAALVYALHPLRTESVAWITERRDLLSALFMVGAVLAYVRSVESPSARGRWLALTGLLWVLSLLSKAWGITLPALLLLIDIYPLGRMHGPQARSLGRLLREKLFLLPVALVFAWLAARAQGDTLAVVSLAEHGPLQRCAQAAFGLAFYVWKTVWPMGLSPLYLLEENLDVLRPRYVQGAVATVVLATSAWLLCRRLPAWTAALCAYAILVSPVLGFLQSGAQVAADRYTYLAGIPLALLAGAGLIWALEASHEPASRAAVGLAASAVVVALGLAARAQTEHWRDSLALFGRMVAVEPGNYFGRHCLAAMLFRDGRLEEAEVHARASIEAHPRPGNIDARYNLVLILQRTGRVAEAEQAARAAVEVDPGHAACLQAWVSMLTASAGVEGAMAGLEELLAAQPTALAVYGELARLAVSAGRPERALAGWHRALEVDPGFPPALHALGVVELEGGRASEAERLFVRALGRDLNQSEVLVDLARAYQAQGKLAEARSCIQQVLLAQPAHARARAVLAAL